MSYFSYIGSRYDDQKHDRDTLHGLAYTDGNVSEAKYDLDRAGQELSRPSLPDALDASMWRYRALMPVIDPNAIVSLGEGWTPLLDAPSHARRLDCAQLYLKDEGRNPTGTFKDRGASAAVSRLRELGVGTVVHNSSGNAAAAWASYTRRAGMRCINLVPEDISPVALQQCLYLGSETYMFDGPWHESGKLVSALQEEFGWFNVGTLKEPYRVEGKKTMGYEICEQLGWQMPEVLVYPTGGALGLVAIYKAFEELLDLGWVTGQMPQVIVVQYEGCAPIVRAYNEDQIRARPWLKIDTLPGGLKSATPSGDRVTLDWVRQTKGHAVAVSATDSIAAVRDLALDEGLLVSAEVGAALAGLKQSLEQGIVKKDARIVVVATGSGLKATSILPSLPLPRLAGLGQFSAAGEYVG